MTRKLRRPIGLLGRITSILALMVAAEFAIGAFFYERAGLLSLQEDEARRLSEHLLISRKLLMETPIQERGSLAVKLTTARYDVQWVTGLKSAPSIAPQLDRMRRQILAWEPVFAETDLRLRLESHGREVGVSGALQLPDRSWIYFRMHDVDTQWDLALGRIALALIPMLAILTIGGLLVRRTLLPLRQLATATERIGHGEEVIVEERGSEDVRNLIRAFNAMQARIHQLIDDRTQMLAAVGHDMRTPIARLRLQIDTLQDRSAAQMLDADLGEIADMIDSLLAFIGGDKVGEERRSIDLAVTMSTFADEYQDLGKNAQYRGPDHLEISLRVTAMRRALRNLIENGFHHGDEVTLSIEAHKSSVVIRVDDNGPGIPEDDIASVLQPFVRLDHARARNTKGLGLGLAIVSHAVEQEGGRLSLINLSRGLRVEIELPIA